MYEARQNKEKVSRRIGNIKRENQFQLHYLNQKENKIGLSETSFPIMRKNIIQFGAAASGATNTPSSKIQKLLQEHQPHQVVVMQNGENESTYENLQKYFGEGLTLYRASAQWYFNFPQDDDYLDIRPKGPKNPQEDPSPDFTDNDNNWTPFTPSFELAKSLLPINKRLTMQYYNKGAINSKKPIYIIQTITVKPNTPIAFNFINEIQIKGTHRADSVETFFLDSIFQEEEEENQALTFRDVLEINKDVELKQIEYDKIHKQDYSRPNEDDMLKN